MSASRPRYQQPRQSQIQHAQSMITQMRPQPAQPVQNQPWKTVRRGTSIRSFSSRGSTGSGSRLPPADSLTFFPPFEQTQMRPRHVVPEDASEEERAMWADWVASADRASLTASLQSLRLQHATARESAQPVEFSLREGSIASLSSIAEGSTLSSGIAPSGSKVRPLRVPGVLRLDILLTLNQANSDSSRQSSTSLCLDSELPSWASPGPASPIACVSPINGAGEFSLPSTTPMPEAEPIPEKKKLSKRKNYGTFTASPRMNPQAAMEMPPSVRLMREIGDRSSISLHSTSVPDLSFSCSTAGATESTSLLPEYDTAHRDRRERSKRSQENASPPLLPPSPRGKLAITPLGDVISIQRGRPMYKENRPRPRAVSPTRKDFARRQDLPPLEVFVPPQSEEGSPTRAGGRERCVTPDFTDLRAFARLGKTEQEPLPPRTPPKRERKPQLKTAGSDTTKTDEETTPRISRGWKPLVRQ